MAEETNEAHEARYIKVCNDRLEEFNRIVSTPLSDRSEKDRHRVIDFALGATRYGRYDNDTLLKIYLAGYYDLVNNVQRLVNEHLTSFGSNSKPVEFSSALQNLTKYIAELTTKIQDLILEMSKQTTYRNNPNWFFTSQ